MMIWIYDQKVKNTKFIFFCRVFITFHFRVRSLTHFSLLSSIQNTFISFVFFERKNSRLTDLKKDHKIEIKLYMMNISVYMY